jgi:mannose-6-phosphate isomerase
MEAGMMETDHRPWGYYTVLADEIDHKVKRIVVYPGKRFSLQRHRRRTEHWYLLTGEAIVTLEGREITLRKGEMVNIPHGAAHRLQNTGGTEVAFIEVQTGEYFGEDDIERLADDYGRV